MMLIAIRRTGAALGLAAAIGLAAPVSAAVPDQPTAQTVTPELAATAAAADAALPRADGIQVARNDREDVRRKLRRTEVRGRGETRRVDRRDVRRPTVVRNYPNRAYRAGYRDGSRHYWHGRWYNYRGGYWYNDSGAIVAASLIGLAAGAAIGSSYANTNTVVVDTGYDPYSAGWYQACGNKYRSFRASDGTYLGFDGVRRVCQIP